MSNGPEGWEWILILGVMAIVFGPKSLPRIGEALGLGIREIMDAAGGPFNRHREQRNVWMARGMAIGLIVLIFVIWARII